MITPQDSVISQEPSWKGKAHGYLGLLAVAAFTGIMLFPWPGTTLPNSVYFQETGAFRLLLSTDEGLFLKSLAHQQLDCKQQRARASSAKEFLPGVREHILADVEADCDPTQRVSMRQSVEAQIEARAPGFSKLLEAHYLRKPPEGATDVGETSEARLNIIRSHMVAEGVAINRKLFIAGWVLHTLTVLLAVFGILYRREVGSLILYPFRVLYEIGRLVGGLGKKVHEKV